MQRNYAVPDGLWCGATPQLFVDHQGDSAQAMIDAIGKDSRPLTRPMGGSTSGSGLQVSLLGLLGMRVGLEEGLEFNVLGLNFGIDLNPPALRLPFLGRIGFSNVATPQATSHTAGAAGNR